MNKVFIILIMALIGVNFISPVDALSIATHVPEKYTDVVSGERFYFEIEVKYPENPRRKDLRLEYEILNQDGNLIAQSKALKAIEIQASFIDFIVIPENTNSGLHIINIKITDYEGLSEEVSSSFQVTQINGGRVVIYSLILIVAILLVGFFVVISILIKKRRN